MPEPHQSPLRRRLTKSNLSVAFSALALLIACTGITPAEAAKAVKRALNADKVNGIAASKTPTPGKLVPLGPDGRFPASVVPQAAGPRGPRGAEGPAGPAGATGAAGSAGAGSIGTATDRYVFRARTLFDVAMSAATEKTIVFGGEDLDPGNAFNPGTSEYTAPVDGVYAFDTTLSLDNRAEVTRSVLTIGTGTGQVLRGTDMATNNHQSLQASGLVKLSKGDRVWVSLWTEHARTVIQVPGYNVFSGYLVARL